MSLQAAGEIADQSAGCGRRSGAGRQKATTVRHHTLTDSGSAHRTTPMQDIYRELVDSLDEGFRYIL